MTDSPPATPAEQTYPPLELRSNGALIFGGVAIGSLSMGGHEPESDGAKITGPELTLHLGWLRLAGLGIAIQGDPDRDHTRSGLVLKR